MKGAREAWHIHDVAASYPLESVSGIGGYCWRSLLLLGNTVVCDHPDLPLYMSWLKQVGIGFTGEVLVTPTENLYHDIEHSQLIRERVGSDLKSGGGKTLRLFAITRNDDQFLRQVGWYNFGHIFSPGYGISLSANDKAALRELLSRKGLGDWVPAYTVVTPGDDLRYKVQQVIDAAQDMDFLVVKAPHLASGEGMGFFTDVEKAIEFIKSLFTSSDYRVIVEAGYKKEDFSVQWEIRPPNGESGLRFVGITKQLLLDDHIHQGNIISSSGLDGLTEDDRDLMVERSRVVSEEFRSMGYVGILGFDFIKTRDGRIFMLETNGRVTAATYPLSVARQLEDKGIYHYGIALRNCSPSGISNWNELVSALGTDLFNGSKGILPYYPNLLPKKVGLMAIETDVSSATSLLQATLARLEAQHPASATTRSP